MMKIITKKEHLNILKEENFMKKLLALLLSFTFLIPTTVVFATENPFPELSEQFNVVEKSFPPTFFVLAIMATLHVLLSPL